MVSKCFAEHKKQLGGAKATTTAPSASALAQTTPTFQLAYPYQGNDTNQLTDNKKDKLRAARKCWHCKKVGIYQLWCPNPFRLFLVMSAVLNKVTVKAEGSGSENK